MSQFNDIFTRLGDITAGFIPNGADKQFIGVTIKCLLPLVAKLQTVVDDLAKIVKEHSEEKDVLKDRTSVVEEELDESKQKILRASL